MLNATKLRASLAVVTLAGAFHLNSANAAQPARADDCDSYARGYAAGMCAAKGEKAVGATYTCNPDGTANIITVTCITQS